MEFLRRSSSRRDELLAARNRVIQRHPRTQFIAAHLANNPEDLATVAGWLDAYPNLSVELASRIGELGRQPYTARQFLVRYADRVLFGTDGPWPESRVRLYWRFLETYDEYFPYSEKEFPPQGFWNIYGVGLPDDVLAKIYHENAAKLIPGVAPRLAAWRAAAARPGIEGLREGIARLAAGRMSGSGLHQRPCTRRRKLSSPHTTPTGGQDPRGAHISGLTFLFCQPPLRMLDSVST